MRLTDIIDPRCVKVPLDATDRWSAIAELVDLLAKAGHVGDREKVIRAVKEREVQETTGIGHGLALPHGETGEARALCGAIGVPAQPIDFNAVDGQPARLVVLLVNRPREAGVYIKTLSRLMKLLSDEDFRDDLISARTAAELYAELRSGERRRIAGA